MPVLTLKEAGLHFAPGGPLQMQLRAAASKGLLSAALRSVQLIQTQEITKASPSPVDRGVYRAGWRAERLGTMDAVIYNAVKWASYIEDGVPARAVVAGRIMHENIAAWAQRRLGFSRQEAWDIAGAIIWKLKRRGIFNRGAGLKILETYTRDRLPAVVREEVERAIERAGL